MSDDTDIVINARATARYMRRNDHGFEEEADLFDRRTGLYLYHPASGDLEWEGWS